MNLYRNGALLLLLCAGGVEAAELDWKLAREEGGVSVYLADVAGSRYKAYRGVVTVKADMQKLLDLQKDVAGSCKWIYTCQEQRLLEREGEVNWAYTRFETPWPVTPRDSILEITTETGADGSITRLLKGVPDRLPEEKEYVRVSKVEGIWRLQPKAEGEIEVIYQVHTEPGGSVPSWLANSFVVDAPLETLKAFKAKAEQP